MVMKYLCHYNTGLSFTTLHVTPQKQVLVNTLTLTLTLPAADDIRNPMKPREAN